MQLRLCTHVESAKTSRRARFCYSKIMLPFGIGLPELIIILVLALIIFGPKRLPDLGKNLGKAISGFKKGMTEAAEEFKSEIDDKK